MEHNGTLPIIHNLEDLKAFWSQLNVEENRLYFGISQIKDPKGAYLVQWSDGYRPFYGKDRNALANEECKDKYQPSDPSWVYGVAQTG